ncbi:hypothetical protein [Ruegeria sp. R14_0]|uniref:hypothetical protein n=1 Tax=Ruegeria sp. R14_0 TaxID=2821100 RepID=UPI001ADC4786|nr:hypothetical protein [Ruegeria sp. R14_0]MBO9444612.1 hypothetical protein [Ruegeria sp. R14_0]
MKTIDMLLAHFGGNPIIPLEHVAQYLNYKPDTLVSIDHDRVFLANTEWCPVENPRNEATSSDPLDYRHGFFSKFPNPGYKPG